MIAYGIAVASYASVAFAELLTGAASAERLGIDGALLLRLAVERLGERWARSDDWCGTVLAVRPFDLMSDA